MRTLFSAYPGIWRLVAASALLFVISCGKDTDSKGSVVPGSDAGDTLDGGQQGDGGPQAEGGAQGDSSVFLRPGESPPGCSGLQCQQKGCAGGASTTISGKVYDPAGNNPLYNIVVYVPNAPLQPMPQGTTCNACESLFSGSPIAVAQTDASGSFTLQNAPEGDNIPLVVQVGKWRKQFTIPRVDSCQDNPQPDKSLRLPRNRKEGDLPNIAISTGEADTLECLLRRIGVDASEYTPGAPGEGRVHIFQGAPNDGRNAPNTRPAAPRSAATLWTSQQSLMPYDILLLSCEGRETNGLNRQALHDYASAGGRVFASHFHYAWFHQGPYADENLATWSTGSNSLGDIDGDIVTTLSNGAAFPKGQALATWLGNVGALTNAKLPIEEARHNADVSASNTPSQPWILADEDSDAPGAAQYFSFNTPTDTPSGPDQTIGACGRVVFSDLHVGAASGDNGGKTVPTGCSDGPLSPQEAALEFMLFDLSSCVTPDDMPPVPPPFLQ